MSRLNRQGLSLARIPWFPLILVSLAYGLLGWHLAAYHFSWLIVSHVAAMLVTATLVMGDKVFGYFFRLGPRSVMTMFILSALITIAVAASTLFALITILLFTKMLARLEIQSVGGFTKISCLCLITLGAWVGLILGWLIGIYLVPSSPFWLEAHVWNWHLWV